MASTYSKITVVPPVADGVGVVPVAVSIKAPNGLTATAYTSRDGSTAFTFPATITVETTFYLTSAGDHEVSAIAGAQQVATQAGKPAQVYAPNSSTDVVVRCVDPVDNADSLAETIATDTAFTSQYAPLAVDQFVDPFPDWFGGGEVNDAIADIVNYLNRSRGIGAPNGAVVGSVGDRYVDTAGTLGARVWHKASGTDTNTGWVCVEGDTGWRKVASWTAGVQDATDQIGTINTTGFTLVNTGGFYMRRRNATIEYGFPGAATLTIQTTGTSSANLFTANVIPTGFQRDATLGALGGMLVGASVNNPTLPIYADTASTPTNLRLRTPTAAGGIGFLLLQAPAEATWPSSLPGVAA